MARLTTLATLLAVGLPAALAQISCGAGTLCPEATPCCSQYGFCGVGAYCLGGCDPVNSHSLDSCVPAPVCQNKTLSFDSNLDGLVENTQYLGDASTADWVYSGVPKPYTPSNSVLLTMTEGSSGTLLASTHYIWYGKTTATLRTSAGAGVITAFILLSDVKDEIDFEFVGVELENAQTNYYFQGIPDYNNGGNTSGLTDVHANEHTYEIDWTPDQITWSIDGNVIRNKQKSETWNATANRYDFPQSPSRVQLSLWPAGQSTNGQGTIEWAGGLIDWNSQYMAKPSGSAAYYYANFTSVSMECYSPPSGANITGSKSYIYNSAAGTNNTVAITDENTVLKSFLGTGTNMSASAATAAASASSSAQTSEVPTVPGSSNAGNGANGQRGSNGTGSSGTSTSSSAGSASTGFVQGDTGSSGGPAQRPEKVLQGSLFAVMVAIVALLVM